MAIGPRNLPGRISVEYARGSSKIGYGWEKKKKNPLPNYSGSELEGTAELPGGKGLRFFKGYFGGEGHYRPKPQKKEGPLTGGLVSFFCFYC